MLNFVSQGLPVLNMYMMILLTVLVLKYNFAASTLFSNCILWLFESHVPVCRLNYVM